MLQGKNLSGGRETKGRKGAGGFQQEGDIKNFWKVLSSVVDSEEVY
jgi:hypothetical protein